MRNAKPLAICAAAALSSLMGGYAQAETPVLSDLIVSANALQEETQTGTYDQPEWTQHRRFSTTRVYVQKDPGEMGIETWYRHRTYDGGLVKQRIQQEFEIGLPYRMQLDLYEKMVYDNSSSNWKQDEVAVELRYAFANWGQLWGNPTIYEEYAFCADGPDKLESKLLFGDDYKGWHWGVNLINEQELWGDKTNEYAVAAGLSRTIIDSKLSLGIEGKWSHADSSDSEFILGPSMQWLPTENIHVDVVAMAGMNNASPNTECWLIIGYDFGSGTKKGYKPTTVGGL